MTVDPSEREGEIAARLAGYREWMRAAGFTRTREAAVEQLTENIALLAEVGRLREALDAIASGRWNSGVNLPLSARKFARNALRSAAPSPIEGES